MLRSLPLAIAIFAAALVTTPTVAQTPPDLPEGARIRIKLLSPILAARKPETTNGIATIHRTDTDSIAFQLTGSDVVRVVPWGQVQELYLSEGRRPFRVAERLGFAAAFTFVGALAGYDWWHTCNDPESDVIWSCIVAPRRLGTSVRFGTWTGLTIGALTALGIRDAEQWHPVLHTHRPTLLIGLQARSGLRIGVNFRF